MSHRWTSLSSFEIEPGKNSSNVDRACDRITTAADGGADLLVLPEPLTVGYFGFDRYE